MALRHFLKPVKLSYIGKTEIGPDIYAFSFSMLSPMSWKAGQHGIVELRMPNGHTARKPFSIASAPSERIIKIVTKIPKESSDKFKDVLLRLKKGAPAKLRGPVGPMHIKDPSKQYALLASGIGITPFRSILKQLALDKTYTTKITLFYVGNKDEHLFKEDLSDINNSLDNVLIKYIYKPERITGQIIEDVLGKDLMQTVFFLAGSPKLVMGYRRTLQGLGIPRKNIKSNPFLSYKAYLANNVSTKLN